MSSYLVRPDHLCTRTKYLVTCPPYNNSPNFIRQRQFSRQFTKFSYHQSFPPYGSLDISTVHVTYFIYNVYIMHSHILACSYACMQLHVFSHFRMLMFNFKELHTIKHVHQAVRHQAVQYYKHLGSSFCYCWEYVLILLKALTNL